MGWSRPVANARFADDWRLDRCPRRLEPIYCDESDRSGLLPVAPAHAVRMKLFAIVKIGLLASAFLSARAEGVALLVPAYFAPSSGNWSQLATAAQRVPLVAI